MKPITDSEFFELVRFIKQNFGIDLTHKKCLVLGRLHHYIMQCGFDDFSEYYHYVVQDQTGKAGAVLLNKLTTNHTYFLREPEHFKFFNQIILPALKNKANRDLRIWSAGCSSGEEPYTIAMLLDSFFGLAKNDWDSKILATDISTAALERARRGVYANSQVAALPDNWRRRYFTVQDGGTSLLNEKIRGEVIFRRFNLMNTTFPFKKKFHVIFCRNVMIYFDAATRQELVNRFYEYTEPGGYLLIGHSESINRQDSQYAFVAPAIYRRGFSS